MPAAPSRDIRAPVSRDLPARMIIELLRSGQRVAFCARGGSMWPAIPSRSRLEIEPCAAAELRVGDVAAFERDGAVVVHRVTSVTAAGVHFQGDTLEREDGCIGSDNVLGRARVIERRPLHFRLPRPRDIRRALRALRHRLETWRGR